MRKKRAYEIYNKRINDYYFNQIMNIAISRIQWENLPETIDERFLEYTLLTDGMAIFFYDEVLGYLTLQCMIGGQINQYRIPKERVAYSAGRQYQNKLNETNSVIIFNNLTHTNCINDIEIFANRLSNIHQTIDINIKSQKTPILVKCKENKRLTLKNLYEQYEGNSPVIWGEDTISTDELKVLNTQSPFIADKLLAVKEKMWIDLFDYLGIYTLENKKERMIVDEVSRSQGVANSFRWSYLNMRKQACEQINKMFNLNIDVKFKDDLINNTEKEGDIIE